MSDFNLLELQGLRAGYRSDIDVLRGIDLTVAEHEVVAILGSNGAGKSTLIAAIAGLLKPSSGSIRFMREDITGLAVHESVKRGLVAALSGRRVFPDQSVKDNLLLGASVHRKDRNRVARQLADMTSRFEVLGRNLHKRAETLSGGQQQILAIARAMMSRPSLLMLDEPSMGLEPMASSRVFELINQIRREGTTLLLIEKQAHSAASVADRIYLLDKGEVVLEGPAAQLVSDPRIERAYLGG